MNYTLTPYQENMKNEWVRTVSYQKMGHKITVAHLTLKNGFEVIGSAGCEDPTKFDYEIGKHFAMVDALSKVDPLVSFLKQTTPEVLRMDKKLTPEMVDEIRKAVSQGIVEVMRNPPIYPRM